MSATKLDFDCVSVIVGLLLSGGGARLDTLEALRAISPGWSEGVADVTENRPLCCVNRSANEAVAVRGLADVVLLANWLASGGRWLPADDLHVRDQIPAAELAGLNFVRLGGAGGAGGNDPAESEPVIRLIDDLYSRGVEFRGIAVIEESARALAAQGDDARAELDAFEAALVGRLLDIVEGAPPARRRTALLIEAALAAHQARAEAMHLRAIGVL
jgi:hypothetical protein